MSKTNKKLFGIEDTKDVLATILKNFDIEKQTPKTWHTDIIGNVIIECRGKIFRIKTPSSEMVLSTFNGFPITQQTELEDKFAKDMYSFIMTSLGFKNEYFYKYKDKEYPTNGTLLRDGFFFKYVSLKMNFFNPDGNSELKKVQEIEQKNNQHI